MNRRTQWPLPEAPVAAPVARPARSDREHGQITFQPQEQTPSALAWSAL
ncbi:hypothetical protein [Pseudomonas capeferrum]|nr:hypothetical protein [Pseudomonas capeferrum]